MPHTFHPSSREAESGGLLWVEARQIYIMKTSNSRNNSCLLSIHPCRVLCSNSFFKMYLLYFQMILQSAAHTGFSYILSFGYISPNTPLLCLPYPQLPNTKRSTKTVLFHTKTQGCLWCFLVGTHRSEPYSQCSCWSQSESMPFLEKMPVLNNGTAVIPVSFPLLPTPEYANVKDLQLWFVFPF